jgi:hypothetical protein
MKKYIMILLFAIAALNSKGQKQEGQTCLFTVLHRVDPSRTVKQYVTAFNTFVGEKQDVYENGPVASIQTLLGFIGSQVDTISVTHMGLINALDSGYAVMSSIHFQDEQGNNLEHEILITGYRSKDKANARLTDLLFYDPNSGRTEKMNMQDFLTTSQLYSIAVKSKPSLCHS